LPCPGFPTTPVLTNGGGVVVVTMSTTQEIQSCVLKISVQSEEKGFVA
jgi:hypothetical protein